MAADEHLAFGSRPLSPRSVCQSSDYAASDVRRLSDPRNDDEEELKWAALEKLPTFVRARTSIVRRVLDDGTISSSEVDVTRLSEEEKKRIMDPILKLVNEDHEELLRRLRGRMDRVGIVPPTIEVRFENLSVEGDVYLGKRGLPTLLNAILNTLEGIFWLPTSKKQTYKMLTGVNGILRPSRMTLLLGPPGSGKTTLLLALAGKLDKDLRASGKITYCGQDLSEFVTQRTCAYISQHDLLSAELTVRETFNFSRHFLGVGSKYAMLLELLRREKDAGIKPDPEIDAFMKATSVDGHNINVVTDYVIKVLGLDICADIIVGNEMIRGISGGQKKRVTIGEMLLGPTKAFFMDEISNGLDSSTTFQIVKCLREMVHVMDETMIISLLQPAPETFNLFDDIILLSEGQIVYQGPREKVLEFFESMGFRCPERKGVADFLQEVTSKKDQEQYWVNKNHPYRYISVTEFAHFFNSFNVGEKLIEDLKIPYDKSMAHPNALARKKYGISKWQLFKVCFSREWLLMKRNSFVYIFKMTQLMIVSIITSTLFLRTQMHHETIFDGGKYLSALFLSMINMMFNGMAELALTLLRLPVFYKERDYLFYPPWAFGLSIWLLRIPLSLMESGTWIAFTYYSIGFAPTASRFFKHFLALFCTHQAALPLFRLIAAAGRVTAVASPIATLVLVTIFVLGGFVISKDDIQPWWIWCYWISPLMYGQNSVAVNEFLDPRWSIPNNDPNISGSTIGEALLSSRGLFVNGYWYWISIGALIGFSLLFNFCFIAALSYLRPFGNARSVVVDGDTEKKCQASQSTLNQTLRVTEMAGVSADSPAGVQTGKTFGTNGQEDSNAVDHAPRRAMSLPFQPLSLSFNHVNYYVDMPAEMKSLGNQESRIQLLNDVSGAFRPGILTALVGVSGAGKTTLLDVLAGRKTGGYIEGTINISGYPKNQTTFARISGYCEQNDIHSPCVTVYESLIYSAWLRLPPHVEAGERKIFVQEIMDLVELKPLRDSLVGLPGVDGLSIEQRKRLTIAVELVGNPSIIFMDEPTSGLDARAAAIVMRTVRNTVDTGRTVVCTIHQPSIDIFEAFDELLLLKQGGQIVYAGSLGQHSQKLIEYFEAIPGTPRIKDGYNPATWVLEITAPSVESCLDLDFAEVYYSSSLYQENQEIIKGLSTSAPDSKDLYFPTKYSQSFTGQYMACFWKQLLSYWRNPPYNAVRLFMTMLFGILFGTLFWNKGNNINKQQDLLDVLGAIYVGVLFVGTSNGSQVQHIVAVERTVLYRERAAGMYSSLAYTFAQVSIEVLYVAVQSLVYTLLLFPMMGFGWQVDKFSWFLYFIFTSFLYFTMVGMMTAALTPGPQIASIFNVFVYTLWNLFSGFTLSEPLMPAWWRWYYWLNPVAWTIYGVVTSQLGNKANLLEIPGQTSVSVKVFLKETLGFEYSFVGYVAAAHFCFILVFFLGFLYGITHLNFQKR